MSREEALRAFNEHRSDLNHLAAAQIILGRVPPEGVLLLTSESLALKEVTYSDAVRQSGDFFLVKRATASLSDILGPSAVHVSAAWDRIEENGHVFYLLRLTGPAFQTATAIPSEEMHRPSQVYLSLARFWGDILQQESHRQLRELGESGQTES